MHPDIALEALRCFDRTELEGLKMHSRYLRDFVDRHARKLPLRNIHQVAITHGEYVRIYLLDNDRDDIFVLADEPHLEMLFQSINNSFSNDLQCNIGILHLEYLKNWEQYVRAQDIDYTLVDFLGVHLKPPVYQMSANKEFREDYAMLFAHDALRRTVKHLVYKLEEVPPPDCLFAALFDADVVESCAIATYDDPLPWIGKFVEMFETAGRETDVVRSVTLLYKRHLAVAPLLLDLKPLGQPWRTDVPKPHCEFIQEWLQERTLHTAVESPVAELFVLENATLAKKLELFVWLVRQGHKSAGTFHVDILNYAFLLRVVDA